jgi:hypothetical protein
MPAGTPQTTRPAELQKLIHHIRGKTVMLDSDLASLFHVPTYRLNEAVRRNRKRSPRDFMFRLTRQEYGSLRSQIAISDVGRGGRRYLPLVFAEQGAAMLSCVLKRDVAIDMNVQIMRAFVRLRTMLSENAALRYAIEGLESRVGKNERDIQIAIEALQGLLQPTVKERKRGIGFVPQGT